MTVVHMDVVVGSDRWAETFAVLLDLKNQTIAFKLKESYAKSRLSEARAQRFSAGDECITGSYNLIYTDKIVKLTEKNVIVQDHFRGKGKTKRMKFAEFLSRNWAYDAAAIAKHNHETSMCI